MLLGLWLLLILLLVVVVFLLSAVFIKNGLQRQDGQPSASIREPCGQAAAHVTRHSGGGVAAAAAAGAGVGAHQPTADRLP